MKAIPYWTRRGARCLGYLLVFSLLPSHLGARSAVQVDFDTILALQSERQKTRKRARTALIQAGDLSLLPGVVDSLFFTASARRKETLEVLRGLTRQNPGSRYYDWIEWLGSHPEIKPHPGYGAFKADLFSRIDPAYARVLAPEVPSRIRLEEIVWGGVKIGGIPSLENPASLAASDAAYLADDELVFGATVNGVHRAYPLRIMDWHEMLADELGGEPVTLSYCTLCRSGILYKSRRPDGKPYRFGTSGLLYRSNKLMIDQETLSLWSNLTGEPVLGPLAGSAGDLRLQVLPMAITRWSQWKQRHPDTTVLDLKPLQARYNFSYLPGAADEARSGVSFPVWQKDQRLDRNTEVYALRIGDLAKAFEVEALRKAVVVNESLGSIAIVVIADLQSGAIRAFDRGPRTFKIREDGRLESLEDSSIWLIGEQELRPEESGPGANLSLPRRPGHTTFWFGWYGFFPETELWLGTNPIP